MKQHFVEWNMNAEAQGLVDTINGILDRYREAGYDLSLRQLYYQLVATNVVSNTEQSYKRIGSIVSKGRDAGLIDWEMIKDRGRECVEVATWSSGKEIIKAVADQFRVDLWQRQPRHVEVMVEKQALEGVLLPVCDELGVPFTANKGYSSASTMYEAARRMVRSRKDVAVVIYLGDHDPSGLDMSRDVFDRLSLYSDGAIDIDVRRVALNIDQVKAMKLPPNPAKMTDSRADDYVRRFGRSSWELDAVDPAVLARLVEDAIVDLRDPDVYEEDVERQDHIRERLEELIEGTDF